NAQDREVVADHDDGFFRTVSLHDTVQSVPRSARDIHESLAAWNLNLCRLSYPFLNKLRMVLPDLCECQTFQCAMIQFANVGLDKDGKSMMQTDAVSGLLSTFQ